jgi:Uma2 family endonuclease
MRTVILGPPPPEVEALIESRRKWGADRHDEVWNGDLHMSPAPRGRHARLQTKLTLLLDPLAVRAGLYLYHEINVGVPDDYRIPDLALLRNETDAAWYATAAVVVEIVSPHDETREKLPFYAAQGVEEAVIVDPVARTVAWLRSSGDSFVAVPHSPLLDTGVAEFARSIDWPPVAESE